MIDLRHNLSLLDSIAFLNQGQYLTQRLSTDVNLLSLYSSRT